RSFSSTWSTGRASRDDAPCACASVASPPPGTPLMIGSLIAASFALAVLLVNRIDHIGHGPILLLPLEHPIDRLACLALVMADRQERGIGVADHVGLGVLRLAIRPGMGHVRAHGGTDDQRELADLPTQLGDDPLGGRLAD